MDIELLNAAIDRLSHGGVVVFPTETVYGLGAHALDPSAVEKVFALKSRPNTNPLIVHVTDQTMARALTTAQGWNLRAQKLADAFWPGPLSIVVPASPHIPQSVTAGNTTVALRCPDHPLALALLLAFGKPLVGPSANLSGQISPTSAQAVLDAFSSTPHAQDLLILDGGQCETGIESTVITTVTPVPQILRPGIIGPEQLSEVLGEPVTSPTFCQSTTSPLSSPGQLTSHYAPRAKATIFQNPDHLEELLDDLQEVSPPSCPPQTVCVLAWGLVTQDLFASNHFASFPHTLHLLELPADPSDYARNLYAKLRAADALAPALIAIEQPPSSSDDPKAAAIWHAVADRLTRATAH